MRIDPASDRAMLAQTSGAIAIPGEPVAATTTMRRLRQPRPWLRLISAVLALAGEQARLLHHGETPWASITFSGSRHTLRLQFSGDDGAQAAETFIAALPDHEFTIAHKLVADATVVAVDHVRLPEEVVTVVAELLLIDDA